MSNALPYKKSISENIGNVNRLAYANCRFSEIFSYKSASGETRILKCLKNSAERTDERSVEDWLMMYDAECESLAGCDISGVPRIYAVYRELNLTTASGETRRYDCAVEMEYIYGDRLINALPNRREIIECVMQIASVLLKTNKTGIYHLDITPGNIICSFSPAGFKYTLIDFTGGWRMGCGYTPVCAPALGGSVPRSTDECVQAQALMLIDILRDYLDIADEICAYVLRSPSPLSKLLACVTQLRQR